MFLDKESRRKAAGRMVIGFICSCLLVGGLLADEQDMENSRDHSLFTRMSNFYIEHYEEAFDLVEFSVGIDEEEKEMAVEGQMTRISYQIKDGFNAPSPYQIVKNHVDAGTRIGAEIKEKNRDKAVMFLVNNGQKAWILLDVHNGGESYTLTVVTLGEMKQEISAGSLLNSLNSKGRVALYIQFATSSADIQAQSLPVIKEIVILMKENPDISLNIEGHTDSSGDAHENLLLSRLRAEAVVKALLEEGIEKGRLLSEGFGASRPVAENDTEDGRAKNRRVELVKR